MMADPLLARAVRAAKWARGTAGRAKRRAERMDTVPTLGVRAGAGTPVRPLHLSLLGGRTLNLAVTSPTPDAELAGAQLHLVSRGTTHRLPLEREPQPHGEILLTLTTPLRHALHDAPEARGPRLRDGRWRLVLVTEDRAGRVRRTPLAAPPPVPLADGPTLAGPPDPRTGVRHRVMRTVDGHAVLKVAGPRRQAELVALDLAWDHITVRGRVLGTDVPTGAAWQAEAVRRGTGGAALPIATRWDGDAFAFELPLAEMTGPGQAQRVWDVRLRTDSGKLRIARKLTDVRHPRRVFRTPFRSIATADGSVLRVHAHLAASGTLAVACARVVSSEDSTR
ncbi:hypothetical protein ACN20G_32410 (plasmid) [Streptomyces sp. BI20]|uniref:hypothetical protein n=1 Tax=Streptomyces sp. BI20 TaxID=3403460 RepID=UPI003C7424A0